MELQPAAEFPNDNPALHDGALWVVRELGEAPTCERRVAEIPEVEPVMVAEAPVVAKEPPTQIPAPPVVEADDEEDDIEIVGELSFEEAIDESPAPPDAPATEAETPMAAGEAPSANPFEFFVVAVEDVARAAGANDDAMSMIAVLVGRARLDASASEEHKTLRTQALAWQGILRGESEDFAACGCGMLDEWAAGLIAVVLGNAQRADGLRIELRRRGVAAFGLALGQAA